MSNTDSIREEANAAEVRGSSVLPGRRLSLSQLALILIWPLVLLGVWIVFFAPAAPTSDVAPVVVYQVNERMRVHGEAGLAGEELIRKLDEEVDVLVQAGYVVIDARTILGTPPEYEVGEGP